MPLHKNLENTLNQGDRLLNVKEVARITGLAAGTLNRARITGAPAPPFVRIGAAVRYKSESVARWIADQHEFNSTSQADAEKAAA